MARTASYGTDEIAAARSLRDQATTLADLRKALSVLLIADVGLDAEKASEVLGISKRTIFRNRNRLCVQGQPAQRDWGGRRNSFMSVDEERAFLAEWESKAAEGGVLTVPPIHAALVKKLGHSVPMSTTYRLLARHGWRKVQPDTKHPKSDPEAQEEFKKNSPRYWRPPA